MIDPTPQSALPLTPSVAGIHSAGAQPSDGASTVRGAKFEALLEQLDLRSQAMARSAREPISAHSLPIAVEHARASLEDALELSKSLLEAWRQSTAQNFGSRVERP